MDQCTCGGVMGCTIHDPATTECDECDRLEVALASALARWARAIPRIRTSMLGHRGARAALGREVARLRGLVQAVQAQARSAEGERDALRRASRALAGMDRETLEQVPPEAMRKVCVDRGWSLEGTRPWPGDLTRIAFEDYGHPTAHGTERRNGWEACVQIPQVPDAADYADRVVDWARAMSSRHGEVSPAEILADAIRAVATKEGATNGGTP